MCQVQYLVDLLASVDPLLSHQACRERGRRGGGGGRERGHSLHMPTACEDKCYLQVFAMYMCACTCARTHAKHAQAHACMCCFSCRECRQVGKLSANTVMDV
jgi:hypothetical protein